MIAVAYCRVSTEDQQERKTIENQIEFAEKYAELHDIKLEKVYKDDGISGTVPFEKREAGRQLLEDAKKNRFDTLLIYKLDRLGRSTRITLNTIYELESYGIKIKSMTEPFENDNPSGRFMITMLAGVADLERSTILERMQQGTDKAAREGKWLGGIIPYGYKVNADRFLEINEEKMECGLSEADVIRKIYNMLAIEQLSTYNIADYLNEKKIQTHYAKAGRKIKKGYLRFNTDGLWRPNGIINIVKNSVYKGVHEYGKRSNNASRQVIKRAVPAIVTDEIHIRAIEQLALNRYKARKNTKNREYLLKGLIQCGYCKRIYIGTSYKRNKTVDGKQMYTPYYLCTGKSNSYKYCNEDRCIGKAIRADKIENHVWELCKNLITSPLELKEKLEIHEVENKLEEEVEYEYEIERLNRDLANMTNEKQNILLLYRRRIISVDDTEKQLKAIENEQTIISSKIEQREKMKEKKASYCPQNEAHANFFDNYKDNIENCDFYVKNKIVNGLIKRIIIFNAGKEDTTIEVEYIV